MQILPQKSWVFIKEGMLNYKNTVVMREKNNEGWTAVNKKIKKTLTREFNLM